MLTPFCVLYLLVRLPLCWRQHMPKIRTLFCLVDIKKRSSLTACVFWFVFLNASSHLCFHFGWVRSRLVAELSLWTPSNEYACYRISSSVQSKVCFLNHFIPVNTGFYELLPLPPFLLRHSLHDFAIFSDEKAQKEELWDFGRRSAQTCTWYLIVRLRMSLPTFIHIHTGGGWWRVVGSVDWLIDCFKSSKP